MKKIRLIVTHNCNRNCAKCVNKGIAPNSIRPFDVSSFMMNNNGYGSIDELIITGGEPMLYYNKVHSLLCSVVTHRPEVKKYMYTAKVDNLDAIMSVIYRLNGIVVAIHNENDWNAFIKLNDHLLKERSRNSVFLKGFSFRLTVFPKNNVPAMNLDLWKVRFIDWLDDCPTPEGEVLMQLNPPLK